MINCGICSNLIEFDWFLAAINGGEFLEDSEEAMYICDSCIESLEVDSFMGRMTDWFNEYYQEYEESIWDNLNNPDKEGS